MLDSARARIASALLFRVISASSSAIVWSRENGPGFRSPPGADLPFPVITFGGHCCLAMGRPHIPNGHGEDENQAPDPHQRWHGEQQPRRSAVNVGLHRHAAHRAPRDPARSTAHGSNRAMRPGRLRDRTGGTRPSRECIQFCSRLTAPASLAYRSCVSCSRMLHGALLISQARGVLCEAKKKRANLLSTRRAAPGLVTLAHVNNEIGTVQDIAAIAAAVAAANASRRSDHRVWLHVDAVQSPGHVPLHSGFPSSRAGVGQRRISLSR